MWGPYVRRAAWPDRRIQILPSEDGHRSVELVFHGHWDKAPKRADRRSQRDRLRKALSRPSRGFDAHGGRGTGAPLTRRRRHKGNIRGFRGSGRPEPANATSTPSQSAGLRPPANVAPTPAIPHSAGVANLLLRNRGLTRIRQSAQSIAKRLRWCATAGQGSGPTNRW